jgi:hypothetical protein
MSTVHKSVVSDISDGTIQQVSFNAGEHQIDVRTDSFVVDGVNEYSANCIDDLLALVTAVKSEYVAYQARNARPRRIIFIGRRGDLEDLTRAFRATEPA